jgi:hypothetical protein
MSFIVVQIEDPYDLDSMSVLPDEEDLKVKQFKNEEEAIRFLVKNSMEEVLEYDAKIVRLH